MLWKQIFCLKSEKRNKEWKISHFDFLSGWGLSYDSIVQGNFVSYQNQKKKYSSHLEQKHKKDELLNSKTASGPWLQWPRPSSLLPDLCGIRMWRPQGWGLKHTFYRKGSQNWVPWDPHTWNISFSSPSQIANTATDNGPTEDFPAWAKSKTEKAQSRISCFKLSPPIGMEMHQ